MGCLETIGTVIVMRLLIHLSIKVCANNYNVTILPCNCNHADLIQALVVIVNAPQAGQYGVYYNAQVSNH